MAYYQKHKETVLNLFRPAISFAQKLQQPKLKAKLEEAQNRLVEGKLLVVVCGETKQGKSEFLNAFLNEPSLFPVDVDITTNLVSTITYGDKEKISVLLGEPGNTQSKSIGRNAISTFVTEQKNKSNHENAQLLVIEAPNPQLRDGLVFVDTPGTGSLNTAHTAITSAFIPNADVILFVTDVFSPLTTEELKFLEERIVPHCQNLIFVVTKIDAVDDEDLIIESNRKKLLTLLNRAPENIPIIPVSSLNKLAYLSSKDSEDLVDSNFETLEQGLWQLLSRQRGQILLLRALGEIGNVISSLRRPVQVEWTTYQENTQAELDSLEQELQNNQKKLKNLLKNNASWNAELHDGLTDIRDDVLGTFQDGFNNIRRQSEVYMNDADLLDSPEQIVGLLEADIDSLISKVERILGEQSATLYANLEDSSGLDLSRTRLENLTLGKNTFVADMYTFETSSVLNRTFTVARNSAFNGATGATVGGLMGGAIGGAIGGMASFFVGGAGALPGAYIGAGIGGLLGNITGIVNGRKEGLRQIKERSKLEVYKQIKPFLEDSHSSCQRSLKRIIKNLERSMRDDLNSQINQEKDTCDRTLQSLKEARNRSHSEALKRSKQVEVLLKEFNQVQRQIEYLAQEILEDDTISSGDWSDEQT